MRLSFLCASHRAYFQNHPREAMKACIANCEDGSNLLQEHRYAEAVPYYGSAFESSEILLKSQTMLSSSALDWYLYTVHGLTEALEALQKTQEAREVYRAAQGCLRQQLTQEQQAMQIMQQLQWIGSKLRRLDMTADMNNQSSNIYSHPMANRKVKLT